MGTRVDCERAATEDLTARYLRGDVSEEERIAFEEHYFECDACHRELEAASEVRELLAKKRDVPRRAAMPRWLPLAASVAAAAGAAVWMQGRVSRTRPPDAVETPIARRPQPPSAGVVIPKELLAVEAPPYSPIVFRDAAPSAWDTAMQRYVRRDYAGAEALLREVHRESPTPAGDFYLAICELLASRDVEAEALLANVAAGDDAIYAGPALLYLGKARLRLGRVAEARDALRRLSASGGPGSEAAREMLRKLAAD
jgi:hypothetical protein